MQHAIHVRVPQHSAMEAVRGAVDSIGTLRAQRPSSRTLYSSVDSAINRNFERGSLAGSPI